MAEFGEDCLGWLGPEERLEVAVMVTDVAADGVLQIGDGGEYPASNALARNG